MIEQAWQAFGFLVALAFVLANVALGKPLTPLPPVPLHARAPR